MDFKQLKIPFVKMHGAGNDYIYIVAEKPCNQASLPILARHISDRHCGVGSDGLVVIMPSDVADYRMRMFNADGSEAQMCGNASRCIARLLYDKGYCSKSEITLETQAGIKTLKLNLTGNEVSSVSVDMGKATLSPREIPACSPDGAPLIEFPVTIDNNRFLITAVGTGNPHGVVFTDEITDEMLTNFGPKLENSDIFPEKGNIEFARVISRNQIEMRVWERGSGETLACGTGACATVVAAVTLGLTDRNVTLYLRGGELNVEYKKDGTLILTGPAKEIAEGIYYNNQ